MGFMDSLAARDQDSDTALLGTGVRELRLKNKDSNYMHVTLNGVVHFKGEAPEVVCCIRPLTEQQLPQQPLSQQKLSHQSKLQVPVAEQQTFPVGGNGNSVGSANSSKDKTMNLAVSCSDGDASRSSDESNGTQQSVLVRHNVLSLRAHEDAVCEAKKWNKKYRRIM